LSQKAKAMVSPYFAFAPALA